MNNVHYFSYGGSLNANAVLTVLLISSRIHIFYSISLVFTALSCSLSMDWLPFCPRIENTNVGTLDNVVSTVRSAFL